MLSFQLSNFVLLFLSNNDNGCEYSSQIACPSYGSGPNVTFVTHPAAMIPFSSYSSNSIIGISHSQSKHDQTNYSGKTSSCKEEMASRWARRLSLADVIFLVGEDHLIHIAGRARYRRQPGWKKLSNHRGTSLI